MIYSLIGMSSAGKTYWSFKLQEAGFVRLTCDDLIEEKLKPELVKLGYKGLADVAKWMGFPYDDQYPQTSHKYLSLENDVMNEIFNQIRNHKFGDRNVIIDTTGSVIYTTGSVIEQLQELSTIIYLEIPEEKKRELYTEFLRNPKPIIWGESYRKEPDESEIEAIARSYDDLLKYRTKRYEEIADITIPFDTHRQNGFSAIDFISHINES